MQRRSSRGATTGSCLSSAGGTGGGVNCLPGSGGVAAANKPYDGKIAGLYDLETTLGRGHYAVVKMARHVFTGEKVAVKVIDKSKLDGLSKEHLFQEVRCMKLVQHPNVVRLYEVIDTQTKLYLVLELADGGDLYDYIMRHEAGLSEPQAREYFGQIVRAISYCHRLHVVHRDLKPENVVFFERAGVVKLTDFGFSNKFCPGQKLETSCGSLAYSAPEILLGDSYDAPAVDVWSLGVILFMLVCGQAPFQEANDSETLTMIMDCKYNVSNHVSDACKRLIGRMLVRDPERRASLDEIASDAWLLEESSLISVDLPLVSYKTLSEADHALIVHKMVQGNICTKEDLLESLERNDYNYITATYYLLAERKLKSLNPKPQTKAIPKSAPVVRLEPCSENDSSLNPSPNILNVARGAGDAVQRSRKCSIVTEDDEEEYCKDRGSSNELVCNALDLHTTLRQAGTVPEPLRPNAGGIQTPVRSVKTLPSPISSGAGGGSVVAVGANPISSPQLNNNNNNISRYERRSKLRKGSTASCSSSDASDEDSEGRNKRKGSGKSLGRGRGGPPDRGGPGDGGGNTGGQESNGTYGGHTPRRGRDDSCQNGSGSSAGGDDSAGGGNNTSGGGGSNTGGGRRVRGETRLRQSQSLNRITEVQHESTDEVLSNPVMNTCSETDRHPCSKPHSNLMTSNSQRVCCTSSSHSRSTSASVNTPAAGGTSTTTTTRSSNSSNCSSTTGGSSAHIQSLIGEHVTNAVLESSRLAVELTAGSVVQATVVAAVQQQQVVQQGAKLQSQNANQTNTSSTQGSKRNALIGRYLMLQRKLCLPLLGSSKASRLYKSGSLINPPSSKQQHQQQSTDDIEHHHHHHHHSKSCSAGSLPLSHQHRSTGGGVGGGGGGTASNAGAAVALQQSCCGGNGGSHPGGGGTAECCSLC